MGCGPGTLALGLAHLFSEVVGVDPDPGMIAEAAREPARRGMGGTQGTPGDEVAVLTRAGFIGPHRHIVPSGQPLERTSDDVVAWVFSMPYAAPHLFGTRSDAFEADVRRLLRDVSPSGRFSERQLSTRVLVWRTRLAETWSGVPDGALGAASGRSSAHRHNHPRTTTT